MKPMYRDPLRLLAMGYTNREIAESLWQWATPTGRLPNRLD